MHNRSTLQTIGLVYFMPLVFSQMLQHCGQSHLSIRLMARMEQGQTGRCGRHYSSSNMRILMLRQQPLRAFAS
ncbi:hypothetical protein BDP27DRAFT_1352124 [Rhodocollybia butyracea]|uniref:Secreted protein n=1 Tax=Rhodocollybia butyracea TaxID=206335 RepID=A0A9P5TV65_9AGAR|nr:hypothetical protein BDP27DRAFT_1352124 [Rhodocollybia butyracea]